EQSGKFLNPVIKAYLQNHEQPLALVKHHQIANSKWAVKPRNGSASLNQFQNRHSRRRVKILSHANKHIINKLNTELLGGQSYPVLTAALGIAAGAVSAGAGLIFTVATTWLSLANTTYRVLSRTGDEIWHVEEIGKENNKPVYVSAYFIVDPYRITTNSRGWLIHEERHEVLLD
ncbi:MAG: hypothetical protein PVG75_15050, partial [Thioalkalispiraceae bacterium]